MKLNSDQLTTALAADSLSLATALAAIASANDGALETYIGGFSNPEKMPWLAFNLSALNCPIGSKLARIPGTVCFDCYALAGHYAGVHAQAAAERRLLAMAKPFWAEACAEILNRKAARIPAIKRFFRWFDAGDIQSLAMLQRIARVCELTPGIAHWIPTKEYATATAFSRLVGACNIPENVCIRLSAYKKNVPGPVAMAMEHGLTTSEVVTTESEANCPAHKQDNACGDCRLCWSRGHAVTRYYYHAQVGASLNKSKSSGIAAIRTRFTTATVNQ